jgi:pilus assembly protein CpaE
VTRLRSERGQAALELIGLLPLMLLLALAAWQLLLTGSAAMTAASAARTGSRAQSLGQDARSAAGSAVPWSHRCDAEFRGRPDPCVTVRGERVDVRVCVPVVMPGVGGCAFELTQSAELPRTD